MNRPSQDQYFMSMAKLVSTRSNCYKRQVGCVLIDASNRVLSTGYNGVPSGYPHCKEGECIRDGVSGSQLHLCVAIHAETNAIIQCKNSDRIHKAYITASPCLPCTVMLLNTPCYEVIYMAEYPGIEQSEATWKSCNRLWKEFIGDLL